MLSAAAIYRSLANDVSLGNWITLTILVALRQLRAERRDTLSGRLLGTLGGAVIALAAALLLPTWAAAVALGCLYLPAIYAMGGSCFRQTLFLTPTLLLFASLGDDAKGLSLTSERVVFTAVGALLLVAAALVLRRWDGGPDAAAPPDTSGPEPSSHV